MNIKKYWTKDEFGRWYLSETKPKYTLDELPYGFFRKCNICGEQMSYRFKDIFDFESKNGIPCHRCRQKKESPSRRCTGCGKELLYINKYTYQRADKNGGKCNSCSKKKSFPII
jgi:hypothetical protein